MRNKNQSIYRAIEELRKMSNAGLVDGDDFLSVFFKLKNQLQPEQSVPSSLTLADLECYDFQYYVGHIADMDGDEWVNQETAELVLLEYNAGIK
jgi:hypothetical protein